MTYIIVKDRDGNVVFAGEGTVEYPEQPVRQKTVAHIREQIAAGSYVTLGKLEMAADRFAASHEKVAQQDPPNLLGFVSGCAHHKRGVDGMCLRCGLVL